ncbi:MAG: RNA polymerase sigma factor [Flavobacteriaceae bacterium]
MNKTEDISDAELVTRYKSGDRKVLVILVNRWHKAFCKQAYWYTKNAELSKDITQDSWTVIIDKLPSLKQPDKFGSWGLSIVMRKAIDSLREQNKYRELDSFSEVNLIEEEVNTQSCHKFILKEIKNLSNEQQAVLKLFYVEGYKIYQIAEILDIAKGTVKSRLFTAREKLKLILKTNNYER